MPINIQNLTNELQPTLDAISNTVTADELLLISNSLQKLDTDRIPSVANTDSLPLLYDDGTEESLFPSGQVYYVDEFDVPVISVNNKWIGLDGRVLRYDEPRSLLYVWGYGDNGRLGTNNTNSQSSPVTVVGEITNWSQIATGEKHSLGVTDTGVLYAWGNNPFGRLGTGDTIDRSSPVTVAGGITNWSKIAGGQIHSLGLTDTGVLYAWGYNFGSSLLGTGNSTSQSSPVTVAGGITNWSEIAAGQFHSFGLTDTGILYAWGTDISSHGFLGTNDGVSHDSPVTVAGGITNWSSVAAGLSHSLGVTDTGVLYAWGRNSLDYRLGLGNLNSTDYSSPVTVTGGITNWSQAAGGEKHSLGLTDTGVLYAWGSGGNGRLGTNDGASTHDSPVTVAGGITNWSQVDAGDYHSLGLTDTGVLYAWGGAGGGLIGTGDTINRSSPVIVAGGITNWSDIAVGFVHSSAIATV